ncbi:MAG: anion permease, partial [Candidatus Hydrogenedentes bacterium]|nr:anion permease [Candidatus Hydrogenedentota bacterium]
LSMVEARQSIQWQTLITIGAAIGLSKGLESSGLVSLVAAVIVGAVNEFGPYALLAAIYLLTSIFTELVTNNAAAALMFPFSIAMADKLGVDPR